MDSRKIAIAVALAGAAAAGAGYLSCGCSPTTTQVITNQGAPAAACLPTFLPMIIDCAQRHDTACAVVHVAELVACWAAHEPHPAPAPAPDAGTAP